MGGIINILIGLVVFFGGGALGVAWIVFCFGTVVVGLLLMFLAPAILFSPLMLSLAVGVSMMKSGYEELTGQAPY